MATFRGKQLDDDLVLTGSLTTPTADINGGSIDSITLGTNSPVTEAQVDNININSSTISSGANMVIDVPSASPTTLTLENSGVGDLGVSIPGSIGVGVFAMYGNIMTTGGSGMAIISTGLNIDPGYRLRIGTTPTTDLTHISVVGTGAAIGTGPNIAYFINSDTTYPIRQDYNTGHDDISMYFDCYNNGSNEVSSDAGSNFRFYKNNDLFALQYDSGITAGSNISWNNAWRVSTDGSFFIESGFYQLETSYAANNRIGLLSASTTPDATDGFKYSIRNDNLTIKNSVWSCENSSGAFYIFWANNNTVSGTTLEIDANGKVGKTSSAKKYKTNINPISDSSWLYSINPVTFEHKIRETDIDGKETVTENSTGITRSGLLADDLVNLKDHLVFKNEKGDPEGIHYIDTIAYLVKEIQNLNVRINNLEGN